ncbi:MAG TPA: NAD-dependent epimerase/dehydratase family protein [Polyangiaceae bacterium]|jgi:uncharacterized protein YbjT (DUF2867 family)|nr:NAD-dependent epimerase/dehydratase family protein [Polyangiaceae bacterium]
MSKRLEKFRVIITGVTGMVGEGVLLECLESPEVEHVLVLGRRPYGVTHAKLEECIVKDFGDLSAVEDRLRGYDACFNCAGVSSAGMSEAEYTRVAYDMVMSFAETLARLDPNMIFIHVTGASTDSTEKGRVMWARVKGRAENALTRVGFAEVYNFRPGLMKPSPGQKSIKTLYRVGFVLMPIARLFFPMLTLHQVGRAMIHAVTKGHDKHVLEVADIASLAR